MVHILRRVAGAAAILALASVGSALAQEKPDTGTTKKDKPKKEKTWKTAVRVKANFAYDDNVFLLSQEQKRKLRTAGPAEAISGRFRDMDNVSDYIFTPTLALEAEGPGIGKRKLALEAEAGYNLYLRNSRRSHFDLDLSAAQETSKNGRVKLEFGLVPHYFQKNYLFDAIDLTGNVDADERVYRRAFYYEWDLMGDYKHRLWKGGDASVSGWIGAGYLRRHYNAVFTGRNRSAPHADTGLDLRLTKRVEVDVSYQLSAVDSPRRAEVQILDEPDFGVDFNGDLDALDNDRRTVFPVDRTFTEHRVRVETKIDLPHKVDLEFGYERRDRHFSSHELFDVNHVDRTDGRNAVHGEISYRPNSRTRLSGGYTFADQGTNRPGDPGALGEISDYHRNGAHVAFTYRF